MPTTKTPKRTYNMPGGRRRNVYLDQPTWEALVAKSGGNVSQAIRELVAEHKKGVE